MHLRLLQLPKVKLSFRQRLMFTAALSAFFIISTCGIIVYLNSVPKDSKADVTLDLFTATLNNAGTQVVCFWVTASETNNSHFDIQRSSDAINYINLTQINGAGNSLSQSTYSYTDENPLPGLSYYRLKQTDDNGEYQFGATQSVNNEMIVGGGSSITVYPLPANNFVFIDISATASVGTTISIIDLTGKIAKHINADLYKGKNKIKLDISELPNGIYFVNAESPNGLKLSQKMIKTE